MRCSPTIRWRTRSDETACATAVLLLLIGALVSAATVGWIIWTGVLATAVIAATLGVVVIVVASSRGRRLRLPPGVPLAAFVIVAVLAVGTAVVTWQQLATDRKYDRQHVGRRAADIAELLTTRRPQHSRRLRRPAAAADGRRHGRPCQSRDSGPHSHRCDPCARSVSKTSPTITPK